MRRQSFLAKLKAGGKLELVEPSPEISDSYLQKAENALNASDLLLKNLFAEEAICLGYYCMYYPLLALFSRCGIKCATPAGSIILFKKLFNNAGLLALISDAKQERVDRQYYTNVNTTLSEAKDMLRNAHNFRIQLRLMLESLNSAKINSIRLKLLSLLKD